MYDVSVRARGVLTADVGGHWPAQKCRDGVCQSYREQGLLNTIDTTKPVEECYELLHFFLLR